MNDMIFHQLFEKETSTYTYLLADPQTREAIIIDPVIETVDRDVKLIEELGLKLTYIFDTHVHADHITASGELRKRTGAKVAVSSAYDLSCPDLHLEDGQELSFGSHTVKVMHTPGHTSGCITYKIGNMVFSGDALLIRGCGRTDFQEGSSDKLFASVREKIFGLPDETIVYPGHDYKGFTKTTVGAEKKFNPRLNMNVSKAEFAQIMANLKLPYPKKIDEAVPANLQCGLQTGTIIKHPDMVSGIPTVTAEDLHSKMARMKIIDVRGMDEYNNELGHIPHSELATLGEQLTEKLNLEDKNKEIVFVCRSGKRSASATHQAMEMGFKNVYNMEGGMLKWNEVRLPVEKDRAGS